ncbi:MAG: PDZ domain-containing protein [Planctomycetota bacterium]
MTVPEKRRCARASLFLILPCLALLAGCTFHTYSARTFREAVELAVNDRGDGGTETFVLEASNGSEPKLEMRRLWHRERATLGLQGADLDRDAAQKRGLEPYRGVLVTSTWPRSAAVAAGVLTGDVVLAIAGTKTVYADQIQLCEETVKVGDSVVVRVLRGQEELDLQLTAQGVRERKMEVESIELQKVTTRHPYCGVVLRGIPPQWSERIFSDDRNGILIGSVDVGSPAWVAGFRPGDVLERVDGGPVPPIEDLAAMIHDRGARGESIAFSVQRGSESHAASMQLADYTEGSHVWFPLVFRVKNTAEEDEWTVGPLGLVVSNESTYVSDPPGREPATREVFRALLGLVRVENSPRRDCVRLLWFIHIDL